MAVEGNSNCSLDRSGSSATRVGPIRWGRADSEDAGYSFVLRNCTFPCWLPALSAAWPLSSIGLLLRRRSRRHRRRARTGCCAKCGYDMRASPERCPEYGMLPEVKA